jgi:hypothetical protein
MKKHYRRSYIDVSCQVWFNATAKKIFSSETAWPNGSKLGNKYLYKVLYKVSSFRLVAMFVGQMEPYEEAL